MTDLQLIVKYSLFCGRTLLYILLVVAIVYPFLPHANISNLTQLTTIYIFVILALGLNVVVGYTGLLHLGIAAFFGIGAYVLGILTVPSYPLQIGFWPAAFLATLVAALCGMVLGAPTLRLRGDYLAIVTLGFGEVVRFTLKNLEEITAGTRTLSPIPSPVLPSWMQAPLVALGGGEKERIAYIVTFVLLLATVLLLRNLERSRLGRSWVAVREDELAATCVGINAARIKMSAFVLGAALAGLAGGLYASTLNTTAGPDAFDFNRSITILCCVILGGLGSIRGTVVGVFLLIGFDTSIAPKLDAWIQQANFNPSGNPLLVFNNWRLMIFGLALVLMMRLRPEGLLPSSRVRREIHERRPDVAIAAEAS